MGEKTTYKSYNIFIPVTWTKTLIFAPSNKYEKDPLKKKKRLALVFITALLSKCGEKDRCYINILEANSQQDFFYIFQMHPMVRSTMSQ